MMIRVNKASKISPKCNRCNGALFFDTYEKELVCVNCGRVAR